MRTFIFSFSLLQNSISIEDFNDYLSIIFNVFNSQYKTVTVVNNILKIREIMNIRNDLVEISIGNYENTIVSNDHLLNQNRV